MKPEATHAPSHTEAPMKTLTLDEITLAHGSHGPEFCGEACAVELSNLIAAGWVIVPDALKPACPINAVPFSDDHPSVARTVRAFVISLNDAWNDEDRQRLRPYAARILCTATGSADEETRAWMATDWFARVHTPAFLRLAGLEEHARALESLARIADAATARAAQPTINTARSAAAAAWDAARDAAWDAAWDAAYGEAKKAAGDVLRPVVVDLQARALDLLDAMIAVGRGGSHG